MAVDALSNFGITSIGEKRSKCCRPQPFASDAKRVEYLFELYEKYTKGLLAGEKPKRKRKG